MDVLQAIKLRKIPIIGFLGGGLLRLWGCDIPKSVNLPSNVYFAHHGNGVCIHPSTEIKSGARIFQQVTIGRADVYRPSVSSDYVKIIIDEYAIIGAGAKIIASNGVMRIGKDAIIGANSVVLHDVPDGEVWAGVPAKKLYKRKKEDIFHGK